MAKKVDASVLDAALDEIRINADMMTACAGEPGSYGEAVEPAQWEPSTAQSPGDVVRPMVRGDFNFECTTAGTTGASEPNWPTTAAATVNDGSVVWTARTARSLADAAMAGGDFVIDAGATSGRKVTVGQKADTDIYRDGAADHVALIDTAGRRLLYVTTASAQTLSAGNTLTFGAWDIEIADPS